MDYVSQVWIIFVMDTLMFQWVHCFTWLHYVPLGCIIIHLGPLCSTWVHFFPHRYIKFIFSNGWIMVTWVYYVSLGGIMFHMGALFSMGTMFHLGRLCFIWVHYISMGSLCFTWVPYIPCIMFHMCALWGHYVSNGCIMFHMGRLYFT